MAFCPTWPTGRQRCSFLSGFCATASHGASTGTNTGSLLIWEEPSLKNIRMRRIWERVPSYRGRQRQNLAVSLHHRVSLTLPGHLLWEVGVLRGSSWCRDNLGSFWESNVSWFLCQERAVEETGEGKLEPEAKQLQEDTCPVVPRWKLCPLPEKHMSWIAPIVVAHCDQAPRAVDIEKERQGHLTIQACKEISYRTYTHSP